jgi:hypothetical protein
MYRWSVFIFISLGLTACVSQPEIPEQYQADVLASKRTPQATQPKKVKKNYQNLLAQTGLRLIETDCQVYSQPNLYSDRVDTAQAGKDVWTEDTGSSWYKIYKNKRYGYVSKICFTQ